MFRADQSWARAAQYGGVLADMAPCADDMGQALNDVKEYSVDTNTWTTLDDGSGENSPGARVWHSTLFFGGRLYVHGGQTGEFLLMQPKCQETLHAWLTLCLGFCRFLNHH